MFMCFASIGESWCPTANTLHTISNRCPFPCVTCIGLLAFQLVEGNTMRPILGSKPLAIWESRKVIPSSCKFLFSAFRCLRKEQSLKKGLSAKTWIDFWYKQKLIHNLPSCSHCRDTTPRKTHNPIGQIQTRGVCWSRDKLGVCKGHGAPKEKWEYLFGSISIMLVLCLCNSWDWREDYSSRNFWDG